MTGEEPIEVRFLGQDLVVQAPAGTNLADIIEASGADVPLGCRTGSCGICRIRVAKGLEYCSSAEAEERDFLASIGAPSDQRLACQVRVMGNMDVASPDADGER